MGMIVVEYSMGPNRAYQKYSTIVWVDQGLAMQKLNEFIPWFIREGDGLFGLIRGFDGPSNGGVGDEVWDPMDLDPSDGAVTDLEFDPDEVESDLEPPPDYGQLW